VSRLGALKAVTLDAAYSLQMEKEVGSIVPGKVANFTILADNPLTVDPMKVKDIRVWGTVHEGRVLPVRQPAQVRAGVDAPGAVVGQSASRRTADEELAQVFAARLAELLAHRHGYDDDAH
jgi:adenine deaminase